MDIHPPEHPIRSVRDFLVHIFTITCGIVIALALESWMSLRADREIAGAARQEFRSELSRNLDKLTHQTTTMPKEFAKLQAMIAYADAKLHDHKVPPPASLNERSFADLTNAAWESALATQAIGKLSFAEADSLAAAYTSQAVMRELTLRAEAQWIDMAAYSGDFDLLSDEQAHAALSALRVSAAYAGTLLRLQDAVMAKERAALQALK